MEGKDQERDAFPSTFEFHIVCLTRFHVQGTYAIDVHPLVLKHTKLLKGEYRVKWNGAYYSMNRKLLNKRHCLLKLNDPKLGHGGYRKGWFIDNA